MGGLTLSAFAIEKLKRISREDEEEWHATLPSQGIEEENLGVLEVVVRAIDPCETCHFTCFTGSSRSTVREGEPPWLPPPSSCASACCTLIPS